MSILSSARPAFPIGGGSLPASLPLRLTAAACSLGAAAIHFMVMGEHFSQWWAYGAFFAVAAWVQVIWAVALAAGHAPRPLLVLGGAGQLGIVVLWLVTRTTGLPFGPDNGNAEAAGAADVVSCVLEVLAAAAALLLLRPVGRRPVARTPAVAAVALLTLAVAGATTAVDMPSVVGHGETMDAAMSGATNSGAAAAGASAGHTHGTTAAGGSTTGSGISTADHMAGGPVTGDIPAGWTAGCMHMPMGGSLASSGQALETQGHGSGACTDAPVTPAQRAAAERLVAVTKASVVPRFSRLADAQRAGYRPVNITGPLWHVANLAYQTDGRLLDPQRPEALVYYVPADHTKAMLLGAMYIEDTYGAPGPLIGGALTSWHLHTNLCVNAEQQTAFNPRADGSCAPGSSVAPTGQMLHVWTVPYEGGPFAEMTVKGLRNAIVAGLTKKS